jgi:hypothetical protein
VSAISPAKAENVEGNGSCCKWVLCDSALTAGDVANLEVLNAE